MSFHRMLYSDPYAFEFRVNRTGMWIVIGRRGFSILWSL